MSRLIPRFQDAVALFEQGHPEAVSEMREVCAQLARGAAFAVTGERSTFYFTPDGVTRIAFQGGRGYQEVATW